MRCWFKRLSGAYRTNILIGLAVVVCLHLLVRSTFVQGALNYVYDLVVLEDAINYANQYAKEMSSGKQSETENSRKICFIDLAEEFSNSKGWGGFVPRNHLADCLRVAAEQGAKVVVLDVLLEHSSTDPAHDKLLLQELERLTRENSNLNIIFPVTMLPDKSGPRPNIADSIIDANPKFYRAIPVSGGSDSDGRTRFIRYFENFQGPAGKQDILWSVSFLAAALHAGKTRQLDTLKKSILAGLGQDLNGWWPQEHSFPINNHSEIILSHDDRLHDRIRYRMIPPQVLGKEHGGTLGLEDRLLSETLPYLGASMRGKIVLLGSSASHLDDVHTTGIGSMAGIYVLGNAINTLVEGLQVRNRLSWDLFVEFSFILFIAWLLLWCPPVFLETGSVLFLLVVMVPLMARMLNIGIFIPMPFLFVDVGLLCLILDLKEESKCFLRSEKWLKFRSLFFCA